MLIKSIKTAGSSVEHAFAQALADGVPNTHETPEIKTAGLYCSERKGHGKVAPGYLLKPHDGLEQVLKIFPEAKKFSVVVCVRNPYDRVVSFFWWRSARKPRLSRLLRFAPNWLSTIILNLWFLTLQIPRGLSIRNQLGPDGTNIPITIRHENLVTDLNAAFVELGIPSEVRLPDFKVGLNRSKGLDPKTLFWKESRRRIQDFFVWEFESLGYEK